MPKVTTFRANPRSPVRIVYNKLLRAWYVVRGPHQTPISGAFPSMKAAAEWLKRRQTNPRVRRAVTSRRRTNPPALPVSFVLSDRALEIAYTHAEDGKDYQHKFRRGVRIQLLADGSARLYRPDGRPLWKTFR